MEYINLPEVEYGTQPQQKALDKRVSVFRHTYINMCEFNPNVCMLSYDYEKMQVTNMLLLAKTVIGLGTEPIWLDRQNVTDYTAINIPGGLKSSGKFNGKSFEIECYPVVAEAQLNNRFGAMVLRIKADDVISARVCGGLLVPVMCWYDQSVEANADILPETNVQICDDLVNIISSKQQQLEVYAKGNGPRIYNADNGVGVVFKDNNVLELVIGFANNTETAKCMARLDINSEIQKVEQYYAQVLKEWKIETPEADIDEAFIHARLNVEFSWAPPYGWIECPHHWIAMWHQEHVYAENWANNFDRTKQSMMTLMENHENGRIMEFAASGIQRREWGGDNNYLFRFIYHYLKMTGDVEFARKAEPYMNIVLKQTFDEYEPLGTEIMAFGCQIGNQEDFEGIPGQGSSSGIEGAFMLRVMATVKKMLGKQEEARLFEARSEYAIKAVYKKFWMRDLGRFAWYEDPHGQMRLDPAHHSICYPILYGNMLNNTDMVMSLDHLLNRLSGPDGEVYISNHFGQHCHYITGTWGMQAGANNQPVATMALAKLGMRDQAIRPLRFIADRVCNIHNGSFPEVANEGYKSYFTPAACMYTVGIIEGIFGIDRDMLSNSTSISPCFPKEWDHAGICIPSLKLDYKRQGDKHLFSGSFKDDTNKQFAWKLPAYKSITALLNGAAVDVVTKKQTGYFEAVIDIGGLREFELEITYEEIAYTISDIGCVAQGDSATITAQGAIITGISDPCGVISQQRINKDTAVIKLHEGLLDKYEEYGWFGLINFARRSVLVNMSCDGVDFTVLATLTVLPEIVLELDLHESVLKLDIKKYVKGFSADEATIIFAGKAITAQVKDDCAYFNLNAYQRSSITPGFNKVKVLIGPYCKEIAFDSKQYCVKYAYSLPLDPSMMKPASYWGEIGRCATAAGSTLYWMTKNDFLQDVFDNVTSFEGLTGVPFSINKNGFIPVSARHERLTTIPLHGIKANKVFVLMSAFISHQDIFTNPFTIELEAVKNEEYIQPVYRKKLYFPGDLDIGLSGAGQQGLPTYVSSQKRGVLPPLPNVGDKDYPAAMPPEYPQHYLWNYGHAIQVCQTVFSIIEIELDKVRQLKEMRIFANNAETGAGIYAISYVGEQPAAWLISIDAVEN